MTSDKNLISLKEAAEASGYSADYIGQLIRAGKIPGKQVYTNIAWMTTAEAVLAYKNKGNKKPDKQSMSDRIVAQSRLFGMQINMLKLVLKTFKQAIPLMVFILVIFFALVFSLIYAVMAPESTDIIGDGVNLKSEEEIRF